MSGLLARTDTEAQKDAYFELRGSSLSRTRLAKDADAAQHVGVTTVVDVAGAAVSKRGSLITVALPSDAIFHLRVTARAVSDAGSRLSRSPDVRGAARAKLDAWYAALLRAASESPDGDSQTPSPSRGKPSASLESR